MLEIKNKTARPLRVPLPAGKTLHLGPRQVAQIAPSAVEHPGLQRLVEDGSIEILGETHRRTSQPSSTSAHEQTHGAVKSFRRGQGDR